MEFFINLQFTDDATDLFLLAKDRLLDVNDWNNLLQTRDYPIKLTNEKGNKLSRSARANDLVQISAINGSVHEMWMRVQKIQYDVFPDNDSECICLLVEMAYPPSEGNTAGTHRMKETILVKREGTIVTAHCNAGDELPDSDARTPNEHLNTSIDLHPVLCIPKTHLARLLQQMIAVNYNENRA